MEAQFGRDKEYEAREIIARLKFKDGLFSTIAKMHENDPDSAFRLILEFSEQCDTRSAVELYGQELIDKVLEFRKKYGSNNELRNL